MDNNKPSLDTKALLKWIATIFTVLGIYAINISPTMAAESVLLFGMFFVAHIIWAVYGWAVKEKSLMWMNVLVLPLDIYAMWIRI